MNEEPRFKVVSQKLPSRSIPIYGEGFDIERKVLESIGAKLVIVDTRDENIFADKARDADALLVYAGGLNISRKVVAALEKCKIIAVAAVGYDNVDISAASEWNIPVTNVPDIFVEEVADHTMMLLLAAWRRLPAQERLLRSGQWLEGRRMLNQYSRLMGQTLAFISFGNIPRAISRRAKPFGLHLKAFDPYVSELVMCEYGVEPVNELERLLKQGDIVSAHIPLTSETHHMISEPQFCQMKASAIFLNTGRGATVDEAALIQALREGWIAFAALDVFEKEPIPPDSPLLKMENVILTSHVGSASSRMPVETRRRVAKEVARVLAGGMPIFPVNKW